jgi:hypothetical protein
LTKKNKPLISPECLVGSKYQCRGKTGGFPARKQRTLNIKQYIYQILMVNQVYAIIWHTSKSIIGP